MKLIITLVLAASMVLCAIDSRGQVTADPPSQTFDPFGTDR